MNGIVVVVVVGTVAKVEVSLELSMLQPGIPLPGSDHQRWAESKSAQDVDKELPGSA